MDSWTGLQKTSKSLLRQAFDSFKLTPIGGYPPNPPSISILHTSIFDLALRVGCYRQALIAPSSHFTVKMGLKSS